MRPGAPLIFIGILFLSGHGVAKDSVVEMLEEAKKRGCEYSYHGLGDKKSFSLFLNQLKKSVKKGDANEVSDLIHYPLRINGSKDFSTIKNKETFIGNYKQIFNKAVIESIESQKIKDLFCNYQGAMLGRGKVWIKRVDTKTGIFAINK